MVGRAATNLHPTTLPHLKIQPQPSGAEPPRDRGVRRRDIHPALEALLQVLRTDLACAGGAIIHILHSVELIHDEHSAHVVLSTLTCSIIHACTEIRETRQTWQLHPLSQHYNASWSLFSRWKAKVWIRICQFDAGIGTAERQTLKGE